MLAFKRIKRDDGRVRLVSPPWSGVVSGFTLLFEALLIQLCRSTPVHNVSQLTGVSDYLIWRVLDVYVDAAKFDEDLQNVDTVGMDETAIAKGHNYITLFVDLQEKRTIHISDGKGSGTVVNFVEYLEERNGEREQITNISRDMSPAFIKGVREQLPKAEITFDKLHIQKDHQRRGGSSDNLASFEESLQSWYFWATHSQLPPMVKAAKTVKRHWDGVINWQKSKINNGILEGLNLSFTSGKAKSERL